MNVGRAARREARTPRVHVVFGDELTPVALDLLELVELAWHDCYGEVTPPEAVIDDLLLLSEGHVDRLVQMALQAVIDWRDLRVAADDRRTCT